MSYREENGQVVLTMSRDDFNSVLIMLGAGTAPVIAHEFFGGLGPVLRLLNRLNEGNPHYTPYEVPEEAKS